ncbi:MAG: stage 0 sporulation family protein [Clostridiales bacterium]|nr:stage 0 sporulation family protein [Clostridiales bacterium]MDY6117604.1 stage 0 sporulation family protein [Anaerovoracaceae bacterium]
MTKVVGVKFRNTGKTYFFDPQDFSIAQGDYVIVETARGIEFGKVYLGITDMKNEDISKPLKPVIRIANEEDHKQHLENESRRDETMAICQELIQKRNLDMKLVDVEFTISGNKVIFYFTADGRVDFRELVKDLASVFHMRIELRQVGSRDEAKMLGGIGNCGKSLCCTTWLSDFQPVSIKMAKNQNLSLNPTKISGVCGRLMCCLKYENDLYIKLRDGIPDNGEKVKTPDGMGKVFDTNILEETVRVRLFTGELDENGNEKLETDLKVYSKQEIQRTKKSKHINKNNNGCESCNACQKSSEEGIDE